MKTSLVQLFGYRSRLISQLLFALVKLLDELDMLHVLAQLFHRAKHLRHPELTIGRYTSHFLRLIIIVI